MGSSTILDSPMQTITNTVNCVGVMGKGVALRFKKAHPTNFADYERCCRLGLVRPGVPYVYAADRKRDKPNLAQILNFPTKYHWRDPSRIEWIDGGLGILVQHLQDWNISSLALPPLGCGQGGLEWREVWPLIHHHLGAVHVPVEVWVPEGEEADPLGGSEQAELF